MFFTTYNPIPEPPVFLLLDLSARYKYSKIYGISFSLIPIPLSLIDIWVQSLFFIISMPIFPFSSVYLIALDIKLIMTLSIYLFCKY